MTPRRGDAFLRSDKRNHFRRGSQPQAQTKMTTRDKITFEIFVQISTMNRNQIGIRIEIDITPALFNDFDD